MAQVLQNALFARQARSYAGYVTQGFASRVNGRGIAPPYSPYGESMITRIRPLWLLPVMALPGFGAMAVIIVVSVGYAPLVVFAL